MSNITDIIYIEDISTNISDIFNCHLRNSRLIVGTSGSNYESDDKLIKSLVSTKSYSDGNHQVSLKEKSSLKLEINKKKKKCEVHMLWIIE